MGNCFDLTTALSRDNCLHIDDIVIDPNSWAFESFIYVYNEIIIDGEHVDPLDIAKLRHGNLQEWARAVLAIRKVVHYKYRTLDAFTVTNFDSSGRKGNILLLFEGKIPNPFYSAFNYINYSKLLTRRQIERFRDNI